MKTSNNGIELIKRYEGFRSHAYKCVQTEKYYTIGFGHYGSDVKENDTITEVEATILLQNDLRKFESKVNKYNDTYKFTQNEFDSLVSFAYNVGSIDQLTQNGKRTKKEIANSMLLYTKSGGIVLSGLVRRRKEENVLFTKDGCENNKTNTYPKYIGTSTKIDEVFKAIGVETIYIGNYKKRLPIAQANNISKYTGSAMQNCKLISLAKAGNLKRVG